MLLVCKSVKGVDGKAVLSPESPGDVHVAAFVDAVAKSERRATRNERISMFMALGSLCIGAAGVWLAWRRGSGGGGGP